MKKFSNFLIGGLFIAALTAPSDGVSAQSVQRIAAIVNDELITAYDLEARIKMVMVSTRLSDSREARRRIRPQVLRTLIDERLQLQEARRRNISVMQISRFLPIAFDPISQIWTCSTSINSSTPSTLMVMN